MPAKLQKYLLGILPGIAALLLLMGGCQVSRHVPPGELLVRSEPVIKGAKTLDVDNAVKLAPNRRVIWPKLYLNFYNLGTSLAQDSSSLKKVWLASPRRERFFDQTVDWLREGIGEPPELIKLSQLKQDSTNLLNAYAAQGFYDTRVQFWVDTVNNFYERRKGKVTYEVAEGKPFHIRQVRLKMPFKELENHFRIHQSESFIKAGERFAYNDLGLERSRFTRLMRNVGFFAFAPSYIRFEVDTFLNPLDHPPLAGSLVVDSAASPLDSSKKWMDVTMVVEKAPERYLIEEIEMKLTQKSFAGTDSLEQKPIRLRATELTEAQRNTLLLNERKLRKGLRMTFLVPPDMIRRVNYNFIADRVYFREGEGFQQSAATRTLQRLQSLVMFQYVLINYEVDEARKRIKVVLEAKFVPQYDVKAGLEAYTNDLTTGFTLPIVGATVGFRNKNTFRRSELLDLSLGGNLGLYPVNETQQRFFWQVQGRANLNFPRFILPFPRSFLPKRYQDLNKLRPVTTLGISSLQEQRVEFDRLQVTGNINYQWFNRTNSQKELTRLSPMVFELIDYDLSPDFQLVVDSLPLAIRRNFQSRFNSRLTASYTISDYNTRQDVTTSFFQINYEGGGNVPRLLELLSPYDETPDDQSLFLRPGDSLGISYGQYVKMWIEGKLQVPLKGINGHLVLRGVLGGALPFAKTRLVPLERRFFAGGPSSMRGWQSNTLGPGIFPLQEIQTTDVENDVSSLLAIGGEYIFEANLELRVDVWTYLELALFTDVGNVWLNPPKGRGGSGPDDFADSRATLALENLYPGWDAGVGFRFDFSFLIIRLDLAQQLFDPGRVGDDTYPNGWVIQNFPEDVGGRNFQINVGIGYPF
jgi:hypothetical protein